MRGPQRCRRCARRSNLSRKFSKFLVKQLAHQFADAIEELDGVGGVEGFLVMSVGSIVVLAFFSALWIIGLIGQLESDTSIMRYLALSLALVAVGVYRFTRHKKQ